MEVGARVVQKLRRNHDQQALGDSGIEKRFVVVGLGEDDGD